MIIVSLALRSLFNRLGMVLLTIVCIALSVGLLVGVEKIRDGARASFAGTVSGIDLIVGARTGNVQLMLYALFRIGDAANNLTWESYEAISQRPEVEWMIPIALGDSHRGYRVIGTDQTYFEHYRYRDDVPLRFAQGDRFSDLFDVVLGSAVARELGYQIEDSLALSHGIGSIGLALHDDLPFAVSGILEPTGTPVDKALHVSLAAIEAIHVDWQSGGVPVGPRTDADQIRDMDLTPTSVTAALIRLNSPIATFTTQRAIGQYREEALSAVIPGMALLELWSVVEVVETALRIVTVFMIATAIIGMVATLLAMINDRRREIAILRSVGAQPGHIVGLLTLEAMWIGLVGSIMGMVVAYLGLSLASPWIERTYGLLLAIEAPGLTELALVALVVVAAGLSGLIPAFFAYRNSVADGIAVKT